MQTQFIVHIPDLKLTRNKMWLFLASVPWLTKVQCGVACIFKCIFLKKTI